MKNDYEVRGEVTAIYLDSKKYGCMETLINTDKLEIAKNFDGKWYPLLNIHLQKFYVHGTTSWNSGKREGLYLHRVVASAPKGKLVDHINHDTLNNTDDNLRIATVSENGQNRNGNQTNNKSGVSGVCWDIEKKKWQANIHIKRKQINLGRFDTIEEAEKAIKEARLKYHPYSQEALSS